MSDLIQPTPSTPVTGTPVQTPMPVIKPLIGAWLAGIGWGDVWETNPAASVKAMYATGFRRVGVPWWMFDPAETENPAPTETSLTRAVAAVVEALSLGMTVSFVAHIDGNDDAPDMPARANYPYDAPGTYIAEFVCGLKALAAAVPVGTRSNLWIVLGNEVSGLPLATWDQNRMLYASLWPQCAALVRQLLPGCKIAVPAPGDQQMGYLIQALQGQLTANQLCYGLLTPVAANTALGTPAPLYDGLVIHYPVETLFEAQSWVPGITLAEIIAMAQATYGLPILIGESWGCGTGGGGSSLAMLAETVGLGLAVDVVQWSNPGGLQIEGDAEVLAVFGTGTIPPTLKN